MIRKVKSIKQILEEFPEHNFGEEGLFLYVKHMRCLIPFKNFRYYGKKVELNENLEIEGTGDMSKLEPGVKFREEWLEPLPEKKKLVFRAFVDINGELRYFRETGIGIIEEPAKCKIHQWERVSGLDKELEV